jgi:Fic family protein
MIGRTRDGTGETAPRELIHLLNATREIEISRLERGDIGDERESNVLFTRPSIKSALPTVSKTRLEQTLYAEYPNLRIWLEKLDGERTLHTLDTLSRIWEVSKDQAKETANQLVDIGFFEPKGSKESPKFRVPFLYRDALSMIQGTAESD